MSRDLSKLCVYFYLLQIDGNSNDKWQDFHLFVLQDI